MRYADLAALVIHARPYRETSAMVQFFTREQGRLTGVMQGLRRGRNPVQVQPFRFGQLSCFGRGGLLTVTHFDLQGHYELAGDALSAGFYVLELITRCLAERQSEPGVFAATHKVLAELEHGQRLAPCLRVFEATLLDELGYGLDYEHDAETGAPLEAQRWYRWEPEQGFLPAPAHEPNMPGWMLSAIAVGDFADARVLRVARRLNQEALAPLLGPQPLVSRSLLSGPANESPAE